MRYLVRFIFVLALGLMGCSETAGGEVFPCTEEGIRDAIAEGGGPHTFTCEGPTTVETKAVILVYKDVILDGEGNLTVAGGFDHRVFMIDETAVFEARSFAITGGVHVANAEGPREQGGGGLLNRGTLVGLGITLSGNRAEEVCVPDPENGGTVCSGGCGAAIFNEGTLHLEGAEVTENEGHEAIHNEGEATIANSTVSRNTGSGIHNRPFKPSLEIIDSTISANSGSGIVAFTGTLGISDSTVSKNLRSGISVNLVTLRVSNTTISENVAAFQGGGLVGWGHPSGRAIVTNSTISGNSAMQGGGVSLLNLTMINSTVSGNVAQNGSAFFFHDTPKVIGTVIEGDCAGGTVGDPRGHNIESPGDTCGFHQPTDQVNVSAEDLKLGPLQDNGGPNMTRALLPGSIAIDVIPVEACVDAEGEPLTTDQRAEPRPGGTMCDVGSFEVQP